MRAKNLTRIFVLLRLKNYLVIINDPVWLTLPATNL